MKAVQVHQYGTPDVLIYQTVADLHPGPHEILIKVEAASVNYADIMRRSNMPYPFPTTLPFIPGSEVAGRIEALGEGVDGPAVGTPVFALVGRDGSSGYAQYAVASANQVIPIPPGLDMEQACALVVAGLTAWLILKEVAHLQPGDSVLIPGASGGVGGYAVQIARLLGAGTIIGATSSAEKQAAALALGADHVVDYTQPDWSEKVRELTEGQGVDVILEMSGGQVFTQSLNCLAPFGRLVVYGVASGEPLIWPQEDRMRFFYKPALNQALHVFNLGLWFGLKPQESIAAMQELIGLVVSGQIKVQVGHVLPLTQAAEAHRLMEARRTMGKVILKPWLNVAD